MIQDNVPPHLDLEDETPARRRTVWPLIAAGAIALAAFGFGTLRTHRLERAEFEFATPPTTLSERMQQPNATRISARLGQVALAAGQYAVFELCSSDRFEAERWQDSLEFAVLHLEAKQLMLRVPLDAAHLARVRRNDRAACLQLGSGPIEKAGTYSVEAIWGETPPKAAIAGTPLVLRVLAKRALSGPDRAPVYALALATFAGLLLWLRASPDAARAAAAGRETTPPRASGVWQTDASESAAAVRPPPRANDIWQTDASESADGPQSPPPAATAGSPARALLLRYGAALGAVGLLYACSQLPSPGSTWTLGKGAILFALQVGLAWTLARSFAPGRVAEALGVVAPLRPALAAASALSAWPLLVAAARFALRLVPSTGEAPIQSFIAWPSGMLAVALLGVLLPAAEELFFRGYLYGALLPLGRLWAAVLSVCLFGLLHAEQSWGNWGGLFAVFSAGAVLCAVRVVSGSTLLSALTHVAYNLSLSLTSIIGQNS